MRCMGPGVMVQVEELGSTQALRCLAFACRTMAPSQHQVTLRSGKPARRVTFQVQREPSDLLLILTLIWKSC